MLVLWHSAVGVYTLHMNSKDVIKRIVADGWLKVSQKGSHKQFKHPTKSGRVTVPHPKRDVPKGTLKSIEKQARIKFDD